MIHFGCLWFSLHFFLIATSKHNQLFNNVTHTSLKITQDTVENLIAPTAVVVTQECSLVTVNDILISPIFGLSIFQFVCSTVSLSRPFNMQKELKELLYPSWSKSLC